QTEQPNAGSEQLKKSAGNSHYLAGAPVNFLEKNLHHHERNVELVTTIQESPDFTKRSSSNRNFCEKVLLPNSGDGAAATPEDEMENFQRGSKRNDSINSLLPKSPICLEKKRMNSNSKISARLPDGGDAATDHETTNLQRKLMPTDK
ncbi:hypothetical protein HAX54_033487, partial [Datura stramonium]|nr:hypothetical protein [Datura stramonium]